MGFSGSLLFCLQGYNVVHGLSRRQPEVLFHLEHIPFRILAVANQEISSRKLSDFSHYRFLGNQFIPEYNKITSNHKYQFGIAVCPEIFGRAILVHRTDLMKSNFRRSGFHHPPLIIGLPFRFQSEAIPVKLYKPVHIGTEDNYLFECAIFHCMNLVNEAVLCGDGEKNPFRRSGTGNRIDENKKRLFLIHDNRSAFGALIAVAGQVQVISSARGA